MTSKLALHCHRGGADIDAAITSAPWGAVKAFNDSAPLATAAAHGVPVRILRLYGIEQLAPGDAVARWLQQDLSHTTHLQLVCENSRGLDPVWQQQVIDGLRPHFGGTFLIGGFPVGNPTQITGTPPHFPELEPLYPLLRLPYVQLAMDEYTSILSTDPRVPAWWPFTAQRHTLILDDLERQGIKQQVVITESGRDGVQPDQTGKGWLSVGWTPAQYLATLAAIDAADQADPRVVCRCVFTLGGTTDWATYEIAPIVPALAAYVQSQATIGVGGGVPPVAILGFDVSNNNGAVNIAAAKAAGYVFGYAKASEGTTFKDGTFAGNWAAMKAAGLVRGAYHFVTHGVDVGAQAHAFAAMVGPLSAGDFIVCDSEDIHASIQQNVDDAAAWCAAVEPLMGVAPFVYLNNNQATNANCSALARYPLILADYQGPVPPAPLAWKNITIWQHTNKANVAGVNGYCDEDFGLVSLDQLRALGYQVPSPPVPVPVRPDQDALTYYQQRGVGIDPDHAIWTVALLPLYRWWQEEDRVDDPLADLIKPGPLVSGETGATWGSGASARPAATVKLSNCSIGTYQDVAGIWHPYRLETA